MNFTQKIYYNDKPIVITNTPDEYKTEHPEAKSYSEFNHFTTLTIARSLQLLGGHEITGILIGEELQETVIKHLKQLYKVVQAGGGLVTNEYSELLLIFRRGKWDLPKGKRDKGETIGECALREVKEETGIKQLVPGDTIGETWHLYVEKSKDIVKHTTWYRMTSTGAEKLLPQAEEDILEVRWVNPSELAPYMANTYRAIKDVMRLAGYNW